MSRRQERPAKPRPRDEGSFSVSLVEALQQFQGRPVSVSQVLEQAGLDASSRRKVLVFFEQLVTEGLLQQSRRGRYLLKKKLEILQGAVRIQAAGHAYFSSPSATEELYIASYRLMGAMDGDEVSLLRLPYSRGRRAEGRVLAIHRRHQRRVVGLCQKRRRDGSWFVRSEPDGMEFQLDAAGQELDGRVVVLQVDRYPTATEPGTGHVVDILGLEGAPRVDLLTIAYRRNLPVRFPAGVDAAAREIPATVSAADCDGRDDLRGLSFVTIDGDDARDFDDALYIEAAADGRSGWRLWVAIADVSHYVPTDSPLDREAWQRGTSVYFPDFCLPMLPEPLSNGICSLNPHVDRLAMVIEMQCEADGTVTSVTPRQAVMRSRARLTYGAVQAQFDGRAASVPEDLCGMLAQLKSLSEVLYRRRLARGALDFELPEAEIRTDDEGRPVAIHRRHRTEAHRLVEECMLLANESVASLLQSRQGPVLYRVHDPPDIRAMQDFQQFVASFNLGLELGENAVSALRLRHLLEQVAKTPLEFVVNRVLLRSMKQARYDAEAGEHFGLASACYGHFTSPIRRYPDLVQHRLLKQLMAGQRRPVAPEGHSLAQAAEQSTLCERRAMEAEREAVDLRCSQFMKDKIGQRFSGFISAVTAFGFFVELDAWFVEGLVPIRTLSDDYYQYDALTHALIGERRRRRFQLGQAVDVEVWQVRPAAREIDFILPEMESAVSGSRRRFAKKGFRS
ncbi:MAG: ribonuclease R [Desulfuromonadaceae bacterium]|nr:ribonuclease R [Desulfuromonadaceae bacterium]